MRTIKFRAWSKKGKAMTYDIVGVAPAEASYGDSVSGDGLFVNPGKSTHYEVMQFTGLIDKNGKEIYEGDLMASHNGAFAGQVIYQAPSFVIKKKPKAKTWFDFALSPDQNQLYEVIGNIYESPDLTQGKE